MAAGSGWAKPYRRIITKHSPSRPRPVTYAAVRKRTNGPCNAAAEAAGVTSSVRVLLVVRGPLLAALLVTGVQFRKVAVVRGEFVVLDRGSRAGGEWGASGRRGR